MVAAKTRARVAMQRIVCLLRGWKRKCFGLDRFGVGSGEVWGSVTDVERRCYRLVRPGASDAM